ncbi:unnamed protein product [Parnassius apollo]|uniref:(apollo) hypothetical protein n=1 Tax=Parnassius apollo TaxID=110799 RepID=A0A8S3Y4I4_PARAO|nr:unnamed protein product [Parnassius apollo]
MAPVKFGLFKARSRDHQEQPSTENLLQSSNSIDNVPGSPIPSTSKGLQESVSTISISMLSLDSDEDDIDDEFFKSQTSIDAASTRMINDDFDHLEHYELDGMHQHQNLEQDPDGTSCDANSSELDVASITASELSTYCASLKKPKKNRSKEERQLRDLGMWRASNIEVMQNLLSRSGTLDEQIKWEAIATARGLCTLTDSCTCHDCTTAKYLAGVADGDGGLGAAPLFGALVGCQIQ